MLRLVRASLWTGLVFAVAQPGAAADGQSVQPQEVLPGFTPLSADGRTLSLGGGRSYGWNDQLLPDAIGAAGRMLAGPFQLVALVNGREISLSGAPVTRFEGDGRVWFAAGQHEIGGLTVATQTRVEYDGLAVMTIRLRSARPQTVDRLELRIPVSATPRTRMMMFSPRDLRDPLKERVTPPRYRGPFVNVIGFADGSRSFWLFADNAEGWQLGEDGDVTAVSPDGDKLEVVQRMVARPVQLDPARALTFQLCFLATPIRDGTPWRGRAQRIASVPTAEEGVFAGRQLWWTDAFAHEDLPYIDYPGDTRQRIPPADLAAYRGRAAVRAERKRAAELGIARLAYFSGHAISPLDPAVSARRTDWEVSPPWVMSPGSDGPFTLRIARPWLSLRGAGLAEYLLDRLDRVVSELELPGLYFDQANVIDSANPASGRWTDSEGRERGSLDILATRAFYMRLAELFHRRGGGQIVVHNIGPAVIPAFTFVDAIVMGEEYTQRVSNRDYFAVVPIDTARTEFAPGQYGIQTIWLEELWQRAGQSGAPPAHFYTDESWRQFAALVLLHDTTLWSVGPLDLRARIYKVLDEFDVAAARFVGYWSIPWTSDQPPGLFTSYYRAGDGRRALLVAVNTGSSPAELTLPQPCAAVEIACPNGAQSRVFTRDPWWMLARDSRSAIGPDGMHTVIPANDYQLIELRAVDGS
jgi:hypothetical protein